MKPIRNSAKALIVKNNCLLVTRNVDANGDWYLLPGGGQDRGETLHEALRRECHEEIGASVRIGDLTLVREYIGKNHEFAGSDGDIHQVEFIFECEVDEDYEPQNGHAIDEYQDGVVWLAISDLHLHRLYPTKLISILRNERFDGRLSYVGDVN